MLFTSLSFVFELCTFIFVLVLVNTNLEQFHRIALFCVLEIF